MVKFFFLSSLLILMLLFDVAQPSTAQTFGNIRDYVKAIPKTPSFYKDNCINTVKQGTKKAACRLKEYNDFGFIVCLNSTVNTGEGLKQCKDFIETELKNLQELDENNIIVVQYNDDLKDSVRNAMVSNVPCPNSLNSNECVGFVQHWLDGEEQKIYETVYSGLGVGLQICSSNTDLVKKIINNKLYKKAKTAVPYGRIRELLNPIMEDQKRKDIFAYNFLTIARYNKNNNKFISDLQGFLDTADDNQAFFAVSDPDDLIPPKDDTAKQLIECQSNITQSLGYLIKNGSLKK